MLYAEFAASKAKPFVELTSRVMTQDRRGDWSQKTGRAEEADTLRYFTRATAMIPTDGIVRKTALAAALATSSPCWKPATWAASAPI